MSLTFVTIGLSGPAEETAKLHQQIVTQLMRSAECIDWVNVQIRPTRKLKYALRNGGVTLETMLRLSRANRGVTIVLTQTCETRHKEYSEHFSGTFLNGKRVAEPSETERDRMFAT